MSLRLRLLALVLAIVAGGLFISDMVTYTSLRSFLTTRFDQQLQTATFPVERQLSQTSGAAVVPPASYPVVRPPGEVGTGFSRTPRGADHGVLLVPGTYGELRSATGKVLAHVFFGFGVKAPAAPRLPAALPGSGGRSTTERFFTVPSDAPGSAPYRVAARALPDGRGTVVVAQPLSDLELTLQRLLLIEGIVSLMLLVGLGALAWAMVRRDLRPIEEMAVTAGAIAGGDLSQRVSHVTPGTEVGRLGLAFNTMIGEIEGAFEARAASEERLRRFLADASHELRTPLTSIRGYAELFDLGVSDRPAELAKSMRHIRAEATRMGALVEDLLLLAQLDHQRPLARDCVDVMTVAEQAVAAARVAAPRRDIALSGEGPALVIGDELRLRQVVDNLLVNAVTHAPLSSAVGVAVHARMSEVTVTVHNDGPAIDAAVAERIFEPFYRADTSRNRSTGGTGLGLAIASAVVTAHDGSIRLLPDGEGIAAGGATFEVRLPAKAAVTDRCDDGARPGQGDSESGQMGNTSRA